MKLEPLEKDGHYHIFNRGINGTTLFSSDENKRYFLDLVKKHLSGKATLLAYCLMDNHFHFAIRILSDEKTATQAFSNLFNAYAKAFNKQEGRSGSLFERPFKRKRITNQEYLRNLIVYIHTNPQNHGIINDFKDFRFSSYKNVVLDQTVDINIPLAKDEVIALFDDIENLEYSHHSEVDLSGFENLTGLPDTTIKDQFYNYIQNLQDTITSKLEEVDGKAQFQEDIWKRPEGGGGRTRVIENGTVFEKGGVNISAVHGALPQSMQNYFGVKDADFFACGLSLVIHPKNPFVPTVHANWRYFEMYNKQGAIVDQWFGGGQDLTPYYLFEEDAQHFHAVCKAACDAHNSDFYPNYKKRCDEYFWNAHRNEARGVGGLFFDYLKASGALKMQDWYNFVTQVGNSFLDAYVPIVIKRKDMEYSKEHRDWQEIRRGRYVEFNLVHDKGTLFGLRTNGRIESILMSLPPHVQWKYDHHPKAGSEEEKLLKVLKQPRAWV